MDFEKILEDSYKETFNSTYHFLMPKKLDNIDELTAEIKTLEDTVDSLYTYDGLDWVGRGELMNNKIHANIAATEAVISDLKALIEKLQSA